MRRRRKRRRRRMRVWGGDWEGQCERSES